MISGYQDNYQSQRNDGRYRQYETGAIIAGNPGKITE